MPRKRTAPAEDERATANPTPTPQLALELAESAGVLTVLSPGRLSRDFPQQMPTLPIILPPSNAEGAWEFFRADEQTLRRFPINQILDWLVDLSPDCSKALWDLTRMCNPSVTSQAFVVDTNEPHPEAQRALDAFDQHLGNMYGSPDRVWNEHFIQAFMRGAMCSELVLDANGRLPIDYVTPDPSTFRFKREYDPIRGPVWVLGQFQYPLSNQTVEFGGFVPMARPTIRYVPIDPMPGVPYGRPMLGPALFPTLFLLTLLHDMRRVIGQQGYPRISITVNLQALMGLMPAEVRMSPAKSKEWIDLTMKEIAAKYAQLEPDDAYIHMDAIEVSGPVGTVDARSIGGISSIIEVLERQSVRAIKSMPIMMALTDGSSEANANRQWEIQVSGLASLQKLAAAMISAQKQLALRAQGIQAKVVTTFGQLRATQALRDEQARGLKLQNNAMEYDRGYTSQEEASMKSVGHPPDQPEPRVYPVTDQPAVGEGGGGLPPNEEPSTGNSEPIGDGGNIVSLVGTR